ncbi:MAG: hypothetical protein M3547_00120 [Acidobacteriota bacterium]|nr:hypothetical protein [Acidobacteriota bacterium]
MTDAASGARAILGRSLEKINAGIRTAGFYDFPHFDSYDLGRFSTENPASAITGAEGAGQGTPGLMTFGSGYKGDLRASEIAFDFACMTGAPTAVDVLTATKSWRAKFRPRRTNAYRAAEFYLHEGGDAIESQYQYGRRCGLVELDEVANERIKANVQYGAALGDTTSAFAIAKTGNTGTYVGKIGSRGRRQYDADYLAEKSVFLKVSAISGSIVTFVAKVATAGDGLGGGFPVGYDTATFVVKPPDASIGHDGWTTVKVGTVTVVGLGGENKEPFQVAFDGTLTTLAVGDEFEIPYQLGVLATTTTSESRFSAFHLERIFTVVGTDRSVKISKGTLRLLRPYKDYPTNGSRYPESSDPSEFVAAELQMTRRLYESTLRHMNDDGTRFSIYSKYQIISPIAGTTDDHETVEVWMPRCRVAENRTGVVATRETLEENPKLVAEQPLGSEALPSGVSNFDSMDAWQANVTASVDLTTL